MTPTPPSTTSSSQGAHSPDAQFRVIRKRNRVPLSCAPCRNRKLKCNRALPCENCVKRGDSPSCSYASPSNRNKRNAQSHGSSNTPDDMQNRIDRLEGLVLSLMTNGAQAAGPAAAAAAISGSPSVGSGGNLQDFEGDDKDMDENVDDESETDQVTKSIGIMKVSDKQTLYIGEAHWAAVMNDIAEVRNYFQTHKKQYEEQMEKINATKKQESDTAGPALLFGATKPPSHAEILSSIPSKYTTDILIARYFNTYEPATHILHGPTFQKQYARHWQDPSKTSPVWIGMLFAMMRLAMMSYHRDGDEPPEFRCKSLDLAGSYRTSMAQCLVLADYTKPHKFVIETLILFLHSEYARSRETEVSVWVLVGMIARLAMRMGYHRDSKMYPNISPFEGEMRRRIWTFVRQADLLFSYQIGLPSMIRIGDSDTDLPRNIYDDEFDVDCKELPPARPSNEATPVSYMIAKARLAFAFGRVLEHVQGIKACPYEEVMKIDNGLREVRDSLPEHLKVRSMQESALDPAALIMSRFNLSTIYHKAQCVLHRRFLARAHTNPRYTHSRRTCIDSSMELLRYQAVLHQETRPNGRMRSMKWHMSSIASHDFLLAATIVCLDLYYSRQSIGNRNSGDMYAWGLDRQDEMIAALEQSKAIWTELKDKSMDAYKASGVLGVMLDNIKATRQDQSNPMFNTDPQDEKQNAAMTLGLLSSGGLPSPNAPNSTAFEPKSHTENLLGMSNSDGMAANAPSPFSMFGATGQLQDANMSLDWEAWDTYIQTTTIDPATNLWGNMTYDIPVPTSTTTNTSSQSQFDPTRQPSSHSSFDAIPGAGPFMGVSSPQPGGVAGWKPDIMDPNWKPSDAFGRQG